MSQHFHDTEMDHAQEVVDRILLRHHASTRPLQREAGENEWDIRTSLSRVPGLHNDVEEISEVEYRQVRLEKVMLVGLATTSTLNEARDSLRELAALAHTAGSQVLDGVVQRRPHPDPATYIGSGKAHELARMVAAEGADTVIVDGELAPSQRRGLEDVVRVKVVDRTALILDIFAQHARSKEGKAQVELAQLQYLLPRLRGWGESMSRQAGGRVAQGAGIGSRGPGETKIELDRRRINQRIAKLRRELAQMHRQRETKRHTRRSNQVPSVALAGYTNAGKSSILNRLTGSHELVHDALFATLDTKVRHAQTEHGQVYTLTDTVGFVSRLPHELVEAFRSTLEEVADADVIVHVVDASHLDPMSHIRAVRDVFADIDTVSDIPQIVALNKADMVPQAHLAAIRSQVPGAIVCSAHTGQGIEHLRAAIEAALPHPPLPFDVVMGYDHMDIVSRLYSEGEVDSYEYLDHGVHISGRAPVDLVSQLPSSLSLHD